MGPMAKALGPVTHGSHNLTVGPKPVREDRLLVSVGILAQHKLERCSVLHDNGKVFMINHEKRHYHIKGVNVEKAVF
jgi:hypothetical protein